MNQVLKFFFYQKISFVSRKYEHVYKEVQHESEEKQLED